MAITRITKGVIEPNENYDTHNIVSTGIITSVGADINGDLDVDGHTNLDNVSISGVTTFAGSVNNLVLSGVVTTTGLDVNGNADISGNLSVGGVLTYEDVTSIDSVGIITARNDIHVGAGVSVVGVVTATTFSGSGASLTGIANANVASNAAIAGSKINPDFSGQVIKAQQLEISYHTPQIKLIDVNNDSDFDVMNQNGVFKVYDRTNSAGRLHIASDGTTDIFQNLNVGAGIDVTGNSTFVNDIDVDGHTNLDNVSIAGVTTFTGNADFSSRIQITSTSPYIDFIDNNHNPDYRLVNANGTFGIFDIGANLYRMLINTNGHFDFKTNVDCEAGLDVTGNITVSGTVDGVDIAALNTTVSSKLSNIVEDTSPQLGADLDTNGFDINFDANKYLTFASTSSAGQIYHTGSHFYVWNGTGNTQIHADQIYLKSNTGNENMLRGVLNGTVELYYNNSKKIETTNSGVTVTGGLICGGATFSGNVNVPDNYLLGLGSSNDLQLYHNGSNSYISNRGVGALVLESTTGEAGIILTQNGSIELRHDNSKKFETTSTGISVTGGAVLTSTDTGSSAEPEFVLYRNSASPADADYLGQIKFNGKSDTGAQRTYAKITGKILDASNGTEDGIIEFAHIKGGSQNISARFRSDSLQLLNGTALTVAGSTTVTGNIIPSSDSATDIGTNSVRFANIYADTLYGDGSNLTGVTSVGGNTGVDFNDNVKARFGTGNDFEIFHDGNETKLKATGSGNITILAETPAGQSGREIRLRNDTGVYGFGMDGNGELVPASNGSNGIGSPSRKFYRALVDSFIGDNADIDDFISVGSNIHLGNAGIITATSYRGDGSQLTGISAGVPGISTTGTSVFNNINASGIITATSMAPYNTSNRSTVVGKNAGESLSHNSYDNVFVGNGAGMSVTGGDGERNTFIGYNSGKANGAYRYNTGVGWETLYSNAANHNTAIGYISQQDTSSGTQNTSLGSISMLQNTHGFGNTALGFSALRNSTTSSKNTCVGSQAGYDQTSGSENTYLGYRVGYSNFTGSQNVCVGNEAGENGSGTGNTLIGYMAGNHMGSGSNVGDYNTFIGWKAHAPSSNTITSASNNVVIGQNIAYALTSAGNNVIIGSADAARRLTSGQNNIVIGREAAPYITDSSDSDNILMGRQVAQTLAGGSNNIILGKTAEPSSATASNEITLGNSDITKFRIPGINVTLKDNGGTPTQGHVLTVDGNGEAGFAAVSADVVNDSSPQLGGDLASNGNDILIADNDQIKLGSSNDFTMYHDSSGHTFLQDQGNGALRIRSDSEVAIQSYVSGTNKNMAKFMPDGTVELYHNGNKKLHTFDSGVVITGDAQWMDNHDAQFGSSADLKIYHNGTHNYFLATNGDYVFDNGSSELARISQSGNFTALGTIDSTSDIKLKTNIKTIDNALDKVLQLRGAEYDRIDRDNQHEIGVIAQEVEKIIPEVVHGEDTKTVSYGNMVAVLIEAIKEQNEIINKMKKEIEELKG